MPQIVDTRAMRLLIFLPATLMLLCCARHPPHNDSFPSTYRTYVDLQPGWRIRTITPLLKSGRYMPEFKTTESGNGVVELSAGDDLIGYETSYYSVTPATGGGVALTFASAENFIAGKALPQPRPLVRLFDFPDGASFVRILFLTRVTSSDHYEAIVAAASMSDLDALTRRMQADPSVNCKSEGKNQCVWVPQGIAVRPEKRDAAHHNNWIPAM
jgi:hypothetical protein